MRVAELMEYLGKIGLVYYGDMQVEVRVKDIQYKFGRPSFLVEPIAGEGQMWLEHVMFKGGVL